MKPPWADHGGGSLALGALLVGTWGGGKTRGLAGPFALPRLPGGGAHKQYRAVIRKEQISSRTP